MDIRLIRKELQVQFSNMNNVDYNNSASVANEFWDFLHETNEISELIHQLPENTVDVDNWLQETYQTYNVTMPRNKAERIALLLAILEKHKDDLVSVSHYFHVGSKKFADHIHKFVDVIVRPIYQYLDSELHKQELAAEPLSGTSITATNAIVIGGNNYGSISQSNNEAVQLLSRLSDELLKSSLLTDQQKIEAVSNIDTMKSQTLSPNPNKQILNLAWQTVSAMATTAGATELVSKITQLIQNLT